MMNDTFRFGVIDAMEKAAAVSRAEYAGLVRAGEGIFSGRRLKAPVEVGMYATNPDVSKQLAEIALSNPKPAVKNLLRMKSGKFRYRRPINNRERLIAKGNQSIAGKGLEALIRERASRG